MFRIPRYSTLLSSYFSIVQFLDVFSSMFQFKSSYSWMFLFLYIPLPRLTWRNVSDSQMLLVLDVPKGYFWFLDAVHCRSIWLLCHPVSFPLQRSKEVMGGEEGEGGNSTVFPLLQLLSIRYIYTTFSGIYIYTLSSKYYVNCMILMNCLPGVEKTRIKYFHFTLDRGLCCVFRSRKFIIPDFL